MKKLKYFGILSSAALAIVATGCAGDEFQFTSSTGGISPILGLDTEVVTAKPKGRAAAAISADDLTLRLTSADGSVSRQWNPAGTFDTTEEFRVGTYTMAAYYGSADEEGFDLPYYYGETTFEVEENKTTAVSLTASLANTMVSIVYTDAFKDYFASYKATVHSASGVAYVDFAADETRPAYLAPGKVTIITDITKQNGVSAQLEAASFEAEAKHHYTVTVDVNGGNAGSAEMVVSFDDTVDEEDVTIDLSDELLCSPAPEIKVTGFDPATTYTVVDGMGLNVAPKYSIVARGGIASVIMTTASKSLEEQGWPVGEIDLCTATAAQQSAMKALGMTALGVFSKPDQLAVIDLTKVLENIKYRENGSNTTTITLLVKDKIGKVTDPVTLTIEIEPIEVGIMSVSDVYPDDETVDLQFSFNGENAKDNVEIQYLNERGTFQTAEVVSMALAGRSASTYNATIKVPSAINPIVLRISCKGSKSEETTVKRIDPEYTVKVNNNDVFATYAYLDVFDKAGNAAVAPSSATIELSTDGGATYSAKAYTAEGTSVKVSGLSSGQAYRARIVYDEVPCVAVSFTTENALQIPNANLDDWYVSATGSYWKRFYVGTSATSVWGTNNEMTTKDGAEYAYVKISGTEESTDAVSGKAAHIRTHGWGSGNSATGSKGTSGACKYTDAGLLHLGSTRISRPSGYGSDDNLTNKCSTGPLTTDDLDCGMAFASRPSSLSFWYKYSPKNSADKGYAEIWVKDAAGNVLASKNVLLEAQGSYTQKTIELSYLRGASKGAKIYVKFLSSYASDYVKRTDDNFSGPGFGNLSNGTFMGSQMWIDEITLNY